MSCWNAQKHPSFPISQAERVLMLHLFIFDSIFDSPAS